MTEELKQKIIELYQQRELSDLGYGNQYLNGYEDCLGDLCKMFNVRLEEIVGE